MKSIDTKSELVSTLTKSRMILDKADIDRGGPWVITHNEMTRYSEMLSNRESKSKVTNFKITMEGGVDNAKR